MLSCRGELIACSPGAVVGKQWLVRQTRRRRGPTARRWVTVTSDLRRSYCSAAAWRRVDDAHTAELTRHWSVPPSPFQHGFHVQATWRAFRTAHRRIPEDPACSIRRAARVGYCSPSAKFYDAIVGAQISARLAVVLNKLARCRRDHVAHDEHAHDGPGEQRRSVALAADAD